jgi:hypothetical protein
MTARPPTPVIASLSRVDRAAGRTIRERDRKLRAAERRRPGRAEAEAHEALIERLTKVHQVAFKRMDWAEIEATGPVVPTIARDAVSQAARRKLAEYRPTLMDTLLGLEREKRRELTNRVVEAARADADLWARAKAEADARNRMLKLAPDVRALKVEAIAGVLKANGAAQALKDVVEGLSLHLEGGRLVARLDLIEYDALPDETCQAGPAGPAWTAMPDADRRQLQLANACSAVLRTAVEVLQAAPADAVEIVARVCRPGGLAETDLLPVLHVRIPLAALNKLQLKKLDAAPTIAAFSGKLEWTAEAGFTPLDLDDVGLAGLKAAALAA